MPIFARTKMILQDNCWDPQPVLNWEYRGPNPQLAYSKIREMFRTIFSVSEPERVQEKDFIWDRKGKREDFAVSWEVSKDFDRFSYAFFRINMKGYAEETGNGKEGTLTVELDAFLRTEYPQDTIWERSIFYEMARVFWHKVLYQEKRLEYMDVCRSIMARFFNELKGFFNLLPRAI